MNIREITSDMAQQQNVEELWAGPAKLTVLRQLEMGRDSHIPTIKAALPALNSFFMRQWKPNRTGAEPQTGGCRIQTLKTSTLPLRTFDRPEEPVQQSKESFFRVSWNAAVLKSSNCLKTQIKNEMSNRNAVVGTYKTHTEAEATDMWTHKR